MIVSDIIDLHRTVQNLLCQQAALFQEKSVDFERAESLSQEVSGLLVSLPTAEALSSSRVPIRIRHSPFVIRHFVSLAPGIKS